MMLQGHVTLNEMFDCAYRFNILLQATKACRMGKIFLDSSDSIANLCQGFSWHRSSMEQNGS